MVAGIIALMLQANPNLGWRDVQEILAYSAWNRRSCIQHLELQRRLGLERRRSACEPRLRLRSRRRACRGPPGGDWQKQSDSTNEATTSHQAFVNEAIPDNTGGSVTSTIHVSENLRINKAVVSLDLDHENLGD